MRGILSSPLVATLARIGLAGVLAWAGLAKLFEDQGTRRRAILAYRVPGISVSAADVLGLLLPCFEVTIGLLLVLGIWVRICSMLTALLMAVFVVGIVSVWLRGYSIDCGCFGGGGNVAPGHTKYLQEILRDVGLVIVAFYLTKWPYGRLSLDRLDKTVP